MVPEQQNILALPVGVVGHVDVGRLLREVEQLDSFLEQAAVREPGTAIKLPRTSRLLDEIITSNKINAIDKVQRQRLLAFLQSVRAEAPLLHMSFSADPSPRFTAQLITWLRHEIHPLVLLQIGLQPNIGAGCILRTTNKYFDFSLREHFKKQRHLLMLKLQGVAEVEQKAEVIAVATEGQ